MGSWTFANANPLTIYVHFGNPSVCATQLISRLGISGNYVLRALTSGLHMRNRNKSVKYSTHKTYTDNIFLFKLKKHVALL